MGAYCGQSIIGGTSDRFVVIWVRVYRATESVVKVGRNVPRVVKYKTGVKYKCSLSYKLFSIFINSLDKFMDEKRATMLTLDDSGQGCACSLSEMIKMF